MTASRTRWLALAAVAAVAVAAVLVVAIIMQRGCRRAPAQGPVEVRAFSFDNVSVESPELAVGPAVVHADSYRGYTDWACLLECREPEGCHAEVRLVLDYSGGGATGRLMVTATLDASQGETMRIGRTQRPPAAAVEKVDRAELEVVRRMGPDAPTPFVVF
jgi:hypothetical protein